nr:hypothetical protein Iba_chr09eCG7090 [Ipomoea batatas]
MDDLGRPHLALTYEMCFSWWARFSKGIIRRFLHTFERWRRYVFIAVTDDDPMFKWDQENQPHPKHGVSHFLMRDLKERWIIGTNPSN